MLRSCATLGFCVCETIGYQWGMEEAKLNSAAQGVQAGRKRRGGEQNKSADRVKRTNVFVYYDW